MIYGAVASVKAYIASPSNCYGGNTAYGYFLLSSLLVWVALSWICMYFAPVEYERHYKTPKNCKDNEADYEKIAKNDEEPDSFDDPSLPIWV